MGKHFIYWGVIAAVVFYFKKCTNAEIKTETVYRTIPVEVKVFEPVPFVPSGYMSRIEAEKYMKKKFEKYRKSDTVTITEFYQLPNPTDTAAIIDAYYSAKTFTDTAKNEYGVAIINDTIGVNTILGRSVEFDLNIPEKTVYIKEKPKRKFFAGGYVGSGIGVGGSMLSKDNRTFYSVGTIFDFKGSGFFIGYQRKIGKK